MKATYWIALVLTLSAMPAMAVAPPPPQILLKVDGVSLALPGLAGALQAFPKDAAAGPFNEGWGLANYSVSGPGFKVQLSGFFDPDPTIGWNVAIDNTSSVAKSFQILLSQSIVPTVGGSMTAGFSGAFSDGGNGQIDLAPLNPIPFAVPTTDAGRIVTTFLGTDSYVGGLAIGDGFHQAVAPGSSPAYPGAPFAAIAMAGIPSGQWSQLGVQLGFSLSAGDSFVAGGSSSISAVPEPAPIALLAAGLLVILSIARCRSDW